MGDEPDVARDHTPLAESFVDPPLSPFLSRSSAHPGGKSAGVDRLTAGVADPVVSGVGFQDRAIVGWKVRRRGQEKVAISRPRDQDGERPATRYPHEDRPACQRRRATSEIGLTRLSYPKNF